MSKALAKKGPGFPQTVVDELRKLEESLGGRAELVGMLALAPLNPDLRYILGLLGDPKHQAKSLAEICALGNILPGELMRHLTSAAMLRGKVQAAQHIGNGIAAVAQDVMRKAAPYEEACSTCQGLGATTPNPTAAVPNPTPVPCVTCQGGGRLVYQPDLDRQKLAIEMANLLPKGGGLQILNQNIAQAAGGSAVSGGGLGVLEKLQALSDRVLYNQGPAAPPEDDETTEGEVVPPEVESESATE